MDWVVASVALAVFSEFCADWHWAATVSYWLL